MKSEAGISGLLLRIAKAFEGLDEREIKEALNILEDFAFDRKREKMDGILRPESEVYSPLTEVNELVEALLRFRSREEALKFLAEKSPSRLLLVSIAKSRKIHISSKEKNTNLINKIVENIVGSRLDSAAVRGSLF